MRRFFCLVTFIIMEINDASITNFSYRKTNVSYLYLVHYAFNRK